MLRLQAKCILLQFYFKKVRHPPIFIDKIQYIRRYCSHFGSDITDSDDNGLTTITTTYEYDGAQFVLEATVDAVQTHNAKDAIKSAWGVDVNISDDGALSLE